MKKEDWKWRNFKPSEFDSPDKPGSGFYMDTGFMDKLQELRDLCGFPFIIVSGFRTPAKNIEVGGKSGSSHMKGLAVDLFVNSSRNRFILIKNAIKCGITRIGVNQSTVHIDTDTGRDEQVIWHYYK